MTADDLTTEGLRLLAAAQAWVGENLSEEHVATGSEACCWCPLCRVISVVRGDRPDVTARLAEAGAALLAALRSAAQPPARTEDAPQDEPAPVQKIVLD